MVTEAQLENLKNDIMHSISTAFANITDQIEELSAKLDGNIATAATRKPRVKPETPPELPAPTENTTPPKKKGKSPLKKKTIEKWFVDNFRDTTTFREELVDSVELAKHMDDAKIKFLATEQDKLEAIGKVIYEKLKKNNLKKKDQDAAIKAQYEQIKKKYDNYIDSFAVNTVGEQLETE